MTQSDDRLQSRHYEVRDVATRLFYEHGYNGTSLKEIAKALGLRAPSLYNHIVSKQQLLQEIMFDGTESLRAEVDAAVSSTKDTLEAIRRGAEAHIRHAAERRLQVHVNMTEVPSVDEPVRTELLKLRADYSNSWRKLIERGVREGVCSTDHSGLSALSIIDLGAGVARWYRPDGPLSVDEMVKFYGDLALRIVGSAAKGSRKVTRSRPGRD